jgi:crotonobetaine/carnitine-CoA ligase
VSRVGVNFPAAFAYRASLDPSQECLVDVNAGAPTRRWSYGELDRAADEVAAGLAAVGVGSGDRVVLRLRNTGEFLLALLGTLRAGAIAVPTIRQYSADELAFALTDCEAACLIFDDEDRAPIEAVVPAGVRVFHAGAPAEAADALVELRGEAAAGEELGIGAPHQEIDASDDALIFYTSGTTSKPKGVVLSHGAILDSCLLNAEAWRLRASDRSYVVLPLFHCNALFMQTIPALLSGATGILGDRYSASRYLDECREHRITLANITAGAIRSLLAQPARPGDRDHEIRLLTFGLPLHGEETRAAEARYGFPVRMCYGLTESAAGGTRGPLHIDPRSGWQSLGPAQSGWEVAIGDPDGNHLPPGEVGEILFRGPGLMSRYWGRPELTAETLRDGWLRTGDLGMIDDAGYAHFHSREKDMLKPKGENVAASEIELALERHPAVVEAAVVGLFDPHHEERVVAVVAGEPCADEELGAHCGALLAPFKVPSEYVWVDELPKTSIGKINKGEIKATLEARPAEAEDVE